MQCCVRASKPAGSCLFVRIYHDDSIIVGRHRTTGNLIALAGRGDNNETIFVWFLRIARVDYGKFSIGIVQSFRLYVHLCCLWVEAKAAVLGLGYVAWVSLGVGRVEIIHLLHM